MTLDYTQTVDFLADKAGILPEFESENGICTTSFETKKALLKALGYDADTPAAAEKSLKTMMEQPFTRALPPVTVCFADRKTAEIPVTVFVAENTTLTFDLTAENGEKRSWRAETAELPAADAMKIGERECEHRVLTLELPEGCRIDSSWNGAFVPAGDTLTVTPMDYNMVIEPKHERDIGFVLWTNETDNILSYKLQVYRMMRLRDLNVFWLLVILAGIYVVSTVTSMFFLVRTRRLALQRQQYLDIVNESFLTFAGMIDAKDPYTQGHSLPRTFGRRMYRRTGRTPWAAPPGAANRA